MMFAGQSQKRPAGIAMESNEWTWPLAVTIASDAIVALPSR